MYRQFKRLIALIMVSFAFLFALGAQSSVSFKKSYDSDDDYKDNPDYGHRIPSRNVIGYIDWDTNSLILPEEIADMVLSYELWTDGNCIISTVEENDFVSFLGAIDYDYVTIVIVTYQYRLIGDYDPQH